MIDVQWSYRLLARTRWTSRHNIAGLKWKLSQIKTKCQGWTQLNHIHSRRSAYNIIRTFSTSSSLQDASANELIYERNWIAMNAWKTKTCSIDKKCSENFVTCQLKLLVLIKRPTWFAIATKSVSWFSSLPTLKLKSAITTMRGLFSLCVGYCHFNCPQ